MKLYYFEAFKRVKYDSLSNVEFDLYNKSALIKLNGKSKLVEDDIYDDDELGGIDSLIEIVCTTRSYENSIENAKAKAQLIKEKFNFNECTILICDENERIVDELTI